VLRDGTFAHENEIGYHPPREEHLMILERFKVPEKDQVHVSESALRRTVTEIFEI